MIMDLKKKSSKANAFYNGWSGGIFEATPRYEGTQLSSRKAAN